MDEKQKFILSCFTHQQVVRFTTLYHFLKGKKTSSILTFGFFNSLLPYFNLFPDLSLNEYRQIIDTLLKDNDLEIVETEPFVKITTKGLAKVGRPSFQNLNGFNYYRFANDFWRMLQFLTQVISEKRYNNTRYIPIESNLFYQYQLKMWIKSQSNHWLKGIMDEWLAILNELEEKSSLLLVEQLMGHKTTGLTKRQLSTKYDLAIWVCDIKSKEALHELITCVLQKKKKYLYLNHLLEFSKKIQPEDTVVITERLFNEGLAIQEIAKIRRLKESTVTDHLIEMLVSLSLQELTQLLQRFQLDKAALELVGQFPNVIDWHFSKIQEKRNVDFFCFRLLQFWLVKGAQDG